MRALLLAGAWALLACRAGAPARPAPASPEPQPVVAGDEDMGAPAAKRAGPPDVAPVTVAGKVFRPIPWGRARGWGQNGGYIGAYDATSGKELWAVRVYEVTYDSELEEDVQDVFIEEMTAGPGAGELTVVDERGRSYRVDVDSRQVRPLGP